MTRRSLAQQAADLEPSAAPWRVDTIDHVGDNWLLADLGVDAVDGTHYIITTDQVPASQAHGLASTDAAWLVWCRNHWRQILLALEAYDDPGGGLSDAELAEATAQLAAWNRLAGDEAPTCACQDETTTSERRE